ncbi:TauD/TfdA family dioxygenase [Streptomyces sp. NEAU-Y11]|uniref:TauD/TfdA family dioxygenase n=1 Tax=Streptomyces cucumeris TaxID=2962890 RepID=UPI0020C8D59A|nr:TauD/TfdA family dioxygenase [Streptomyces sp. NEAU-Y11]MCP9211499.1 TauD/TfdA family dioxygenase [Streptomyces sp. NEAU-Y11]
MAVADARQVSEAEAAEAVARYRLNGFALVQFTPEECGEDTVEHLAQALELGEPFVPPLYTKAGYASPRVSSISAPEVQEDSRHPHFETTVGQDLHCDGTLQDIGVIKSAVLLCCSQGAEGGESFVFNAHAAFAELLDTDPAAARALTSPGVLVRRATFNGSDEANRGPAFAVIGDRLVCRYCVDATDRWETSAVDDPVAAGRGLEFLRSARQEGSPYSLRFTLAEGQAIVMDNTRISHGRSKYRDGPGRRRRLLRSLHLRHPGGG